MKLGYAYAPLTINARTNNKIASKNFDNEKFLELFKENLNNLKDILNHNIKHKIQMFRLHSDILENIILYNSTKDWTSALDDEFEDLSNIIKKNNLKIFMFPQKYTILNSPNDLVIQKAISFLEIHAKFMNALGLDSSNKIVLEIGGVYTNKENAIQKFVQTYKSLPKTLTERLVLINDNKNYSFDDLINISKKTNAPITINTLYDKTFNFNSNLTLKEKIQIIKDSRKNSNDDVFIHYSQQKHSAKHGEQADTIFTEEFIKFYNDLDNLDINLFLDFNDSDISVIKCKNIINELKDKKITKGEIYSEFKKYELLIDEKGGGFHKEIKAFSKTTESIIEFYKLLDKALENFIDNKKFSNSLRDALKEMIHDIKLSEKNHIEKLLLNSKLKRCKKYMFDVAVRNNAKGILETYFFSQL